MALVHRGVARHHGPGSPAAGQSAARTLGPQPFPLSRSAQSRAGGVVAGTPCAEPRRAGAARDPDHHQRHIGGTAEYGVRGALTLSESSRRRPGPIRRGFSVLVRWQLLLQTTEACGYGPPLSRGRLVVVWRLATSRTVSAVHGFMEPCTLV